MQGEELKLILCRMAPGMSLTVPDEWIDKHIAGTNASRAALVKEIARQHLCSCRQNYGSQTFEKQEVPFTG
ncbi:hypothetical protein [Bosea sp. 117]|uniref:hypothetical protein n=1 Tax=Bosea sp. 117 TaxID=1125973 RepID=UPI000494CBA5|nr:hypothetical protein [Bosea sp. 117]